MIELASKLTDVIQSGNILWLAVVAIVAFSMKLSKILEFFESRRKIRIARLIDASKCEQLDEGFKEFLSHEVQREYFLYIANIAAEKQYRDKLFELHKKSNGNLPFFHFRRVSGYMRFHDGVLSVKITRYDIFSGYMGHALVIFFGFIGLAMLMMPIFIKPVAIIQAIALFGMGAFYLSMAVLFAVLKFPLQSAKLIKDELRRVNFN